MQVNTIQPYEPPFVVQSIGNLFASLSQSALVFATDDYEGQTQYVKELLGVFTIIFSIWLVWSCLLLMFRGANNCSAQLCCPHPHSKASLSTIGSYGSKRQSLNGEHEMQSTNALAGDDDSSSGASFDSSIDASQNSDMDSSQPPPYCHSFAKTIGKQWYWILRILFLLASTTLISSSALVFTKASFPAISALETTDHLMEEVQLIVATIQRSIRVIQETSTVTFEIEGQMKSDLISLCPDFPHFYLVHELGVDPYDLVLFVDRGNRQFSSFFDSGAIAALDMTVKAESQLQSARDGIQVAQDWIWILPLLMLCLTIVTFIFLFSMLWAIFQEKYPKWYYAIQQEQWESMMSWTVVSLFAILSTLVWVSTIALSLGSIAVTDVCLPTPEDNLLFVLQNMDDTVVTPWVLDTASAFMTGCQYSDPLDMLHAVEGSLNGLLGIVDSHLHDILTNGYGPLELACGPNNKLDSFFASVSQLSYYLRNAHDAAHETHRALECVRVSELYHALFYETLCSDFASAVSFGFILVFTVAIASLQVLTVRGAWNYVKPRES